MRRQVTQKMILLVVCLVFALALSGTVAADDSQGGALDDNVLQSSSEQSNISSGSFDDDPRIYGVIKENTTPANGATIAIKNPTTNVTLASGTTNSNGEYDIYFTSSLTEFKVEISYLTYKIFSTTVTPTGTPIVTANLNHTFMPSQMLQPTKLVIIIGGQASPVQRLLDAYNELYLEGYDFEMRVFDLTSLCYNPNTLEKFVNELKTTNILFITSGTSSIEPQGGPMISEVIDQYLPGNARIIQRSASYYTGKRNSTRFSSGVLASYSKEAIKKRTLLGVLKLCGVISNETDTTATTGTTTDLLYHPDAPNTFNTASDYMQWYASASKLKEGGVWIGMAFDSTFYNAENLDVYDAVIRNLESKGINVITLSQYKPLYKGTDGKWQYGIYEDIFMINGTSLISALIVQSHASGFPDSIDIYNKLNVPILGLLLISQTTLQNYLENSTGITGGYDLNLYTNGPETTGRIGTVLTGGLAVVNIDELTGTEVKVMVPYQPGVEQLCNMAIAWANLRHKANNLKKLALIYIDNTHDETMPFAAGLNLPESLSNILAALETNGYNLGSYSNMTAAEIMALINDHGRNPLNYTPNDLLQLIHNGAITISKEEYLQWYSQLSESLKTQVEAVWGPAPGNMMLYQDQIVIPGIMLGNIFLGVQPIWKWNGTLSSIYNSENLPPTHQYIAFYLWLQNKFNADAYVQIGDHGTLELLPGHSVGMTADDWPNTLIGPMPHIYVCSMSGGSTAAKRRAYAVTITHLIPPVVETQLYGNLAEAHDLIAAYEDAYNQNDTARMQLLKNQIWSKINSETGLSERLGINSRTNFGVVLNKLHDYLHSLLDQITPHGLHTFGELPDNETLEKFIDAIIAFDPETRYSQRDEIRNLLIESASNEINSLLRALNGGYIETCSAGDPIRSLDTLPTGRNKYAFDPRKVPDSAAMIIGGNAVEKILERYLEDNNGKYPETIAMPVSGGEVRLTYGQSIASIFYLLGIKPVYSSGMVVDIEIIPLSTLGRPRIDVLIQASSSLRDSCPQVVSLIDDAIAELALLDEPIESNYIRKHYLAMLPVLEAELKAQGKGDDEAGTLAERLARARIFGLPPGADPHGVGVARLMRSDSWTDEELAETYLDYNSYIYGNSLDGVSGISGRMVMEKLLYTVDTTMAISPSTTRITRYSGSARLNFMVNYLTGKDISSYIIKTGDGSPRILTLKESMYDDLILTIFNPTWREGLMKEGYSGHATMALRIRSLFSTDALVDVISSSTWQKIADTYLFDQSFYSQLDPAAAQMISNVIYQANQRGMMRLSSGQADQLSQMLGKPVTGQSISAPLPGTTSSAAARPSTSSQSFQSTSVGASSEASVNPAEVGDQSVGDSAKSYEVSEATSQGVEDIPWGPYAVLGIISVLALAGIGFFFKGSLLGR